MNCIKYTHHYANTHTHTDYDLPNNNRMCVYCVREISLQLNQENGKSYGTGFFGKVQI